MDKKIICSKYYIYLICIIISFLLSCCIYGQNHNETFETVSIASEHFSSHHFIHRFFSYFFTIFCGICFHIYIEKTSKSEITEEETSKENKNANRDKLIYNDYQRDFITNKFILFFILMIFAWILLDDLIEHYIIIFQDLDFWMFELIFLCLLNYKLYKVEIYKHQLFAIILSLLSSFLKIGSIIISFQDNHDNYRWNLPIFYEKNMPGISITFGILFYFCLILSRAYVNLKLKWYMEKKFISPNKLIIWYGSMGTIIYLIICIVSNYYQCKEDYPPSNDGNIDFTNYICRVNETNFTNNNYTHYYLENFEIYFDKFINFSEIWREVLVIILGCISFFGKQYSSILVIKYLTPAHVIFSIPIVFLLQKVVMTSYTYFKTGDIFSDKNKFKIRKFCLDISGDILSVFGFLIYLELIVIYCCKCDYNTKANIMRRSFGEVRNDISNDSIINDEEIVLEN